MTEKEYSHDPQIPPAPDPCEHHTAKDIDALFRCDKVADHDSISHATLALVRAVLKMAEVADNEVTAPPKPKPEPEGDADDLPYVR